MRSDLTGQLQRHSSIILTDWAAEVDSMGPSLKALTYELMLLSLVYDRILIQDEVFALSDRLALWFRGGAFDLLERWFRLGTVTVLTHTGYKSPSHKRLAQSQPIAARAEHIKTHGTKSELPFSPTAAQRAFYASLDQLLTSAGGKYCRPVRADRGQVGIMTVFNTMLEDILTEDRYSHWRAAALPALTEDMTGQVLLCLRQPEATIEVLRRANRQRKNRQGRPILDLTYNQVFDRSLAYRLARTFDSPRAVTQMKSLIQTTFAPGFCAREDALLRCGGRLVRESPWERQIGSLVTGPSVLEEGRDMLLAFPHLDDDFVTVIRDVRADTGHERHILQRPARTEEDCLAQQKAWTRISKVLAKRSGRSPSQHVRHVIVSLPGKIVTGTIVASRLAEIAAGGVHDPKTLIEHLGVEAVIGGVYLAGNALKEVLAANLQHQRVRRAIERSMALRSAPPALGWGAVEALVQAKSGTRRHPAATGGETPRKREPRH